MDRIIDLLETMLGATDIKENTIFVDDLDIDSLDDVEILMAVEKEFNTDITDEEWNKVIMVKDIHTLLTNKGVKWKLQS